MACYAPQRVERSRAGADTAQVTTQGLFPGPQQGCHQGIPMIYTIAVVLVVLWLLGLVSSYTVGGLIHVLLVIAIVMVLLRIINGQKPI
jgi:hypothetical protein